MADIDIAGGIDNAAVSESIGRMVDVNPSRFDGITIAEDLSRYMGIDKLIFDAITVAESVSTPTMALKLYRGLNSITVSLITQDWVLTDMYWWFKNCGIPLKALTLIPGSGAPDTFSIKSTNDTGPYIFFGVVSTPTTLTFGGVHCRPLIDYSECILSTGHMVTFMW